MPQQDAIMVNGPSENEKIYSLPAPHTLHIFALLSLSLFLSSSLPPFLPLALARSRSLSLSLSLSLALSRSLSLVRALSLALTFSRSLALSLSLLLSLSPAHASACCLSLSLSRPLSLCPPSVSLPLSLLSSLLAHSTHCVHTSVDSYFCSCILSILSSKLGVECFVPPGVRTFCDRSLHQK